MEGMVPDQENGRQEQVVTVRPEKKAAPAEPLCDILLALMLITMIPMMFGMVSGVGTIAYVPCVLMAYPVVIVGVVFMFKDGDVINATVNGVLTSSFLGQNAISGIIYLVYSVNEVEMPAEVQSGLAMFTGMSFLVAGIFVLALSVMTLKADKVFGVLLVIAGVGFLCYAGMNLGLGTAIGTVGSVCFVIFAVYMLYRGISLLFPPKEA